MGFVNIPAYFHKRGLLTFEQGKAAHRHIESSHKYRNSEGKVVERQLFSVSNITGDISFGRWESCRFIDWLFDADMVSASPVFGYFIIKVANRMARSPAGLMNRSTPRKFRRVGFSYYRDAIAGCALSILFGSGNRTMLKIDSIQVLPKTVDWREPRMQKGSETIQACHSPVVLLNGRYPLIASELLTDWLYTHKDRWFVINNHPYCEGHYSLGRRVVARSTMMQTAIAVAGSRNGFMSLEVGPTSYRISDTITEHRESLRDRRTDYRFNAYDASIAWCETTGKGVGAKYLRVELDRPCEETSAYEFYVSRTGDRPHVSTYYENLAKARKEMLDFFSQEEF